VSAIDVKGWDTGWKAMPTPITLMKPDHDTRGLILGHDVYLSKQYMHERGAIGYQFTKIPKHEFEAAAGMAKWLRRP
jgi:hypothetical protein